MRHMNGYDLDLAVRRFTRASTPNRLAPGDRTVSSTSRGTSGLRPPPADIRVCRSGSPLGGGPLRCCTRRFTVSLAWHALVVAQGGRCAICNDQLAGRICVDHDHSTGAVRGLLCSPCNTGIGHLRDNADIVESAAAYLRHHG